MSTTLVDEQENQQVTESRMKLLDNIIEEGEQSDLRYFLEELRGKDSPFFLRDQILEAYDKFGKSRGLDDEARMRSDTRKLLEHVQEMVFDGEFAYIVTRRRIGKSAIYGVPRSANRFENVPVERYLRARDSIVLGRPASECQSLEIDVDPFVHSPMIMDARNIGKGVDYFLRYLSSRLFSDQEAFLSKLLGFLKIHQLEGIQLMLSPTVPSLEALRSNLMDAIEYLEKCDPETPVLELTSVLSKLGFERGWGYNAERTLSTMELLNSILENPDHEVVGEFLARIPMIHKIVILSPHGWFAQENVLGRPDTGGQVVYILNQVRALENEISRQIARAGLWVEPKIIILTRLIPEAEGTSCNVRLEPVEDTDYSYILRIPFRRHNPEYSNKWISRFEIWPYLEEYAIDAEKEVLKEMGERPDLIIGNYSDGNIVAYLMSRSMGVTYCTIAHALEKAKYLYSDLNWQSLDDRYHFSLQFTADLIAMCAADITVTSTYQEIAGTPMTIGQYESYRFYNMPGLYRVKSGANMFHPRFNIVPPGVDERFFFPATAKGRRNTALTDKLVDRIFHGSSDESSRFHLDDPDKKPIYSIARLDYIKNITGLVEAFGKSRELRDSCNIIVVAGHVDRARSKDREEQEQIDKMYALVEKYNLEGSIRWLEMEGDKAKVGEMYRLMADKSGIFVQPALFEAFGLTVLEAMACGLPTVATRYGGPLETIVHNESGCHINPNDHEEMVRIISPLVSGDGHEELWQTVSVGGIARVKERFTWDLHCSDLLRLSKIYGYWKYASQENSKPQQNYLDTLYQLLFKPMAQKLLEEHDSNGAPAGSQ